MDKRFLRHQPAPKDWKGVQERLRKIACKVLDEYAKIAAQDGETLSIDQIGAVHYGCFLSEFGPYIAKDILIAFYMGVAAHERLGEKRDA